MSRFVLRRKLSPPFGADHWALRYDELFAGDTYRVRVEGSSYVKGGSEYKLFPEMIVYVPKEVWDLRKNPIPLMVG